MKKLNLNEEEILKLYLNGFYSSNDIALKYNCSSRSIRKILEKHNIPKYYSGHYSRKYFFDELFFDSINTEEKAYFLGLLYADGYINNDIWTASICLQDRDVDILYKLKKAIKYNGNITYIDYTRYIDEHRQHLRPQYCLKIYSKFICNQLIKLGCTPKKTFTLEFPTFIPDNLIRHFIRGYFDGDGSISHTSDADRTVVSYCGTENVCIGIRDIIYKKLKINVGIYKNRNIFVLYYRGKSALKVMSWLYDKSSIYLDRKFNKYINEKEDCFYKNGYISSFIEKDVLLKLYSKLGSWKDVVLHLESNTDTIKKLRNKYNI